MPGSRQTRGPIRQKASQRVPWNVQAPSSAEKPTECQGGRYILEPPGSATGARGFLHSRCAPAIDGQVPRLDCYPILFELTGLSWVWTRGLLKLDRVI